MNWMSYPKSSGYYWMKHREKYRHKWSWDVIWYSENNPGEIRHGCWWTGIDSIYSKHFFGPLERPRDFVKE